MRFVSKKSAIVLGAGLATLIAVSLVLEAMGRDSQTSVVPIFLAVAVGWAVYKFAFPKSG